MIRSNIRNKLTADLSSIASMTVDVERRQQSHQLLLVTAPARTPELHHYNKSDQRTFIIFVFSGYF